jgi:hypothetical protein
MSRRARRLRVASGSALASGGIVAGERVGDGFMGGGVNALIHTVGAHQRVPDRRPHNCLAVRRDALSPAAAG